MINPIYHEQTNYHRGWVRNTLGSEEPILLPVLLRGVGLRLSQRPLHKASRQLYQRAWKTPAGRRYLSQTSEAMNEEDTSLYGKNREGKVALCETCAYDGYCRDKIRYYRCRNYIKIKDDYDKNERNVAGIRWQTVSIYTTFHEKNPGGLNIPTIIFTFVDYWNA